MAPSPFSAIARIVKTHGLKGEVAVEPAADLPFDVLIGLEVWFVPPPATVRTGQLVGVRRGPKGPLLSIDTVPDIDTASKLSGCDVMVRTESLPPAWTDAEDEPSPDDVLGMLVRDEAHGELGEIVEVIETGANDVWVVEGDFGEVLLPVIDDVILDVDWDADTVLVKLLPGLLPEESEAV